MRATRLSRQRGLTLIEFMISVVLGLLLVAALSTLIANQSVTRSEVDRAGRLIENGRYSVQAMSDDLQMAGYWGEIINAPAVPATLPDPCSTIVANVQTAMGLHVQGYDDTTYTAGTLGCVSNWKSGTDILVVRYADPDTARYQTGGATDFSKLVDGEIYLQSGLTSATNTNFTSVVAAGDSPNNSTNFPLVNKDGTPATPRKMLVHIYYVATCDVCTGTGADTIPTLKRVELSAASGAAAMTTATIAEGVEALQLEYGRDTDGDGAPDGSDSDCSSFNVANWADTMSVKVYLLARATDQSPGFTDNKTYTMGNSPAITPAPADAGYQRHLFEQSVRVANPSMRRSG